MFLVQSNAKYFKHIQGANASIIKNAAKMAKRAKSHADWP